MKKYLKNISFYVLLFAIMLVVYVLIVQPPKEEPKYFSDLVQSIEQGNVEELVIEEGQAMAKLKNSDKPIVVEVPNIAVLLEFSSPKLKEQIVNGNIKVSTPTPQQMPWWLSMFPYLILIVIMVLFWVFFFRQAQGGGGKAMNFGKSKAKVLTEDQKKVNFGDVAGADEEKADLEEIVEFLKNPAKYTALGARIPKGVLLVGPPGTGKTLLAKAVAGEAGVPFFSISGSDFVEMFVGVGASRVRDLFEEAKKATPSVIFIDEIDAVGRHRGAGLGGGHDEREQTLNQLLVEMDGFGVNEGVIVIAATNRPDILDPALLRPGRFDRQIVVNTPDLQGRVDILKVHARNKKFTPEVDFRVVAKTTAGFTGADLENLLNEAALLTARKNKTAISNDEIQQALMKVMMGAEKKSRVMSEKEKKLTAYHEAGHAVITRLMPGQDPVHEVSIIPRGRAGGYTMHLPQEDKNYATRGEMNETIRILLGGRAAEKIILGDISTGASNDIERASDTARKMVTRYGMSDKLGPIAFGTAHEEVFIGRDYNQMRNYSEDVAIQIDEEVHSIVSGAYQDCINLLTEHIDKLHVIAKALLEFEKLDGKTFEKLFSGDTAAAEAALDAQQEEEHQEEEAANVDDKTEE